MIIQLYPTPLYSIIFIRTYYYLLVVHHTFKTGMMADSARLLTDAEIYYSSGGTVCLLCLETFFLNSWPIFTFSGSVES